MQNTFCMTIRGVAGDFCLPNWPEGMGTGQSYKANILLCMSSQYSVGMFEWRVIRVSMALVLQAN